MNLNLEQEKLREEFIEHIGKMPNPPPLAIEVLYKEHRAEYDEWKISYIAETPETMPTPAGQTISAYLLVPRWKGEGPFPAMVCFHQCNVDCVLAKEAVVGKTSESTPDQRYGFELVRQGFVVLAPDSINCGERNIPSLRQKGENSPCWPAIANHRDIGRSSINKKIYDGMRAVDVLQSLEFVDSNRIGAIGHSMGSSDAFNTMAYDARVQAVILSGLSSSLSLDKYLPLHSPRLHIAYKGILDDTEYPPRPDKLHEITKEVHMSYEQARRYWDATNSGDNLVLRMGNAGHVFTDEFKNEAYAKLRHYFAMVPQKTRVLLKSMLEQARQDTWVWNKEERYFPTIKVPDHYQVMVDKEKVQQAFTFLFVHLYLKLDESMPALNVSVVGKSEAVEVHCAVPAQNDSFPVGFGETGERVFIENDGAFRKEQINDRVNYIVTLKL